MSFLPVALLFATVLNKGVSGENSAEGKARFERDVVDQKPDAVLIYFGLNDTLNEPKFLSREVFLANLEWMIDKAREQHIVPLISSIHHPDVARLLERHKPESYAPTGPTAKVDLYNGDIRNLASRKDVPLADFCLALDKAGGASPALSSDGVHLTARGNRLLAATFYRLIMQLPHRPAKIVCFGDSVTFGQGSTSAETYPAFLQRMFTN